MTIDAERLRREIADDLFGGPLIQNSWRGEWAERLVLAVLGKGWQQVGADWLSHDLKRADGLRVEVKQAAARQSWYEEGDPPSKPAFDIAPRTGYYQGATWCASPGRRAHVYVFAWHPGTGKNCDHADIEQWRFFVVRANRLPDQKTIGLAPLRGLSDEFGASGLPSVLSAVPKE